MNSSPGVVRRPRRYHSAANATRWNAISYTNDGCSGTPAAAPGIRAASAGVSVMPQARLVGVPGSSVSRHPTRPIAMPSATAGANRSPVLVRYPTIRLKSRAPRYAPSSPDRMLRLPYAHCSTMEALRRRSTCCTHVPSRLNSAPPASAPATTAQMRSSVTRRRRTSATNTSTRPGRRARRRRRACRSARARDGRASGSSASRLVDNAATQTPPLTNTPIAIAMSRPMANERVRWNATRTPPTISRTIVSTIMPKNRASAQ